MAKRPAAKPAKRSSSLPVPASPARRSAPATAPGRLIGWLFLIAVFALSLFFIAVWFPALLGSLAGGLATLPGLLVALWTALLAAVVTLVGLALPLAVVCLVPAAVWLHRRDWPPHLKARWWLAGGLSALVIFVALGMIRPADVTVAAVPLAEVSAGGQLGRALAGSQWWDGLLRLLALTVTLAALLAPRPSFDGLRWAIMRGWGLTQRSIHAGAATLRGWGADAIGTWRARRARPAAAPLELDLDDLEIAEEIRPNQVEPAEEAPAAPATSPTTEEIRAQLAGVRKKAPAAPRPAASSAPGTVATLGAVTPGSRSLLPPIDLLDEAPIAEVNRSDIQQRVTLIEETLVAYGVNAKVVQVAEGPTVTQFGVEPGWDVRHREVKERDPDGRVKLDKEGNPKVRLEELSRTRVKVNRITALANDLALALAAPTIRIEAPVPGKPIVGIEVPNRTYTLVTLRSVIESPAFQRIASKSKLALALGQNVAGEAVAADLAKMPHLLIAGSTGSGKSVCLNAIVVSILMQASPTDVRMLMVDPKRVELVAYNGIPHLLSPVITEAEKVVGVLGWVIKDMDNRYRTFAEAGARNIEAYNRKALERNQPTLPYEVVIIDELADLMMVAPDEVERQICRLAQLARATGIHLIVATQRPSVDVLTGLIKANFPTRISFAVSSQVDSRTILDAIGAEKLLGRGDMLYLPPDAAKPARVQGNYVSDREIDAIVEFWKQTGPPRYLPEIEEAANRSVEDEPDALFEEAKRLIDQHPRVSVSFLQRKLRIGYNRAARLMDQLEEAGLVDDGSSTRPEDGTSLDSSDPFA